VSENSGVAEVSVSMDLHRERAAAGPEEVRHVAQAQRSDPAIEKLGGVESATPPLGSEADYRGLFDQSLAPLSLVSAPDGLRFVAASRGFLNSFDLRRPAIVGRRLEDLFTPESSADLKTAIERCLTTSESVQILAERRKGSSRHVIRLVVHPARARGFAGHVLLQAEGRNHSVHSLDQAPPSLFDTGDGTGQSMTYVHDLRRQRMRYADSPLSRRLGLSGGAVAFDDLRALIHPDDLPTLAAYEATRHKLADDEFVTSALRLRDEQDEWRVVSIRARVLRRDRSGAARMMLGNATDITDYAHAAVEAAGVSVRHAEENERARIGRELHDSTSQHLVGAVLGLATALRGDGLSAPLRAQLKDIQRSLDTAQTEIRAFAYFLHPPELRELGLRRTVERFCEGFARRSGLAIAFNSSGIPNDLSSDAEHALFRVCQEALMNVYRHAFARKVAVDLQPRDGHLVLEVRDDGVGVDGVDRFEHGGIGVAGMRARMLSVGGDLILDYLGPGLGVVARVPSPA
jgi:signal transduction histidine kinase